MMGVAVKGVVLLMGLANMHAVSAHHGPVKVLRVGRNQVELPMKGMAPATSEVSAIESAALSATQGGQIESIRASVWVGQPVWMCTVKQGINLYHVMVDQTTLRPISKIVVPR